MRPSLSLSMPSEHCGIASVSSVGEEHPGSFGKSVRPSSSLSMPSEHCASVLLPSLLSAVEEHPGSFGKSVRPSPSLSAPSEHCGIASVSSLAEEHPGSFGKSMRPSPSLSTPSEHCVSVLFPSLLSAVEEHPGSIGKSVRPSLSLSTPSEHCAAGGGSGLSESVGWRGAPGVVREIGQAIPIIVDAVGTLRRRWRCAEFLHVDVEERIRVGRIQVGGVGVEHDLRPIGREEGFEAVARSP